MSQSVSDYASQASESVGTSWNRFWYAPANPLPLSVLRIIVGLLALYYLFSFTGDLVEWFGPNGLLPIGDVPSILLKVDQYQAGNNPAGRYHPSVLTLAETPTSLWVIHSVGLVAALLLTVGLFSRISCLLTLVFALSYMHRAPMIIGQMEPVLSMALLYLCIGPSGARLSVDRWLAGRKAGPSQELPQPSWLANLSLRLLQVHVAGLYLLIGFSQATGIVWQDGTAIWWLAALSDSRLIDVTGFLAGLPLLVNVLTHLVVGFELCFGVLIWNRTARPALLAVSIPIWVMLALLSGLVGYCVLMLALGVIYLSPAFLERVLGTGRESKPAAKAVAAAA